MSADLAGANERILHDQPLPAVEALQCSGRPVPSVGLTASCLADRPVRAAQAGLGGVRVVARHRWGHYPWSRGLEPKRGGRPASVKRGGYWAFGPIEKTCAAPRMELQRKTRLRWHHRMKTYTDQIRDQYMPGAPSRKARHSRSTATGSSPTGATACGSRRVWSMASLRPRRIQRSNGRTNPLLRRSNSAGSRPRRPMRRSTAFWPSGQ